MRQRPKFLLLLAVAGGIGMSAWWFTVRENESLRYALESFSLAERPHENRYVFDYAGVLGHYEEGAQHYLERLSSRFDIEAVIVSVPELPATYTAETLAVDLARNWRIGAQRDGRGLLLLLVDETQQVKLEVGYRLEHVFTDAFSGYVSQVQLEPYYRAGDVGTGLIAVMEMLEERARIEDADNYTPGGIARADDELVTGGAGKKLDLSVYHGIVEADVPASGGRGAASPEEAWEIMLAKWAGEGANIDVDVYTEMTRRAMGDANVPDPRKLTWLGHWRKAEYRVLRDGDYAVIWFGHIDGWENSPFLFCNPGDGWKFDIVWQRRLIVMAENPKWQVAQGPYPYTALMHDAWQSTGKDLPLGDEDIYHCDHDTNTSAEITELEKALAKDPDDAQATIELLRLSVNTNRRPNVTSTLIQRAKQLAPDNPDVYKYAALYNVTAFFQYRTAMEEIGRFIQMRPNDPFGYNMKGFLLYRLAEYADSNTALEAAVELDPDDGYAYIIMARNHVMLARQSSMSNAHHTEQAAAMQRKARHVPVPDQQRLVWLDRWLRSRI